MADEIGTLPASYRDARQRFEDAKIKLRSEIDGLKNIVRQLQSVADSKPSHSSPDTSSTGEVPSRDSLLALQDEFLSAQSELDGLARQMKVAGVPVDEVKK